MMFGPDNAERRYRESRGKAMQEHRRRMIDDGMLSEEHTFNCLLAPMDYVGVQRIGPEDTPSTYIRVRTVTRGGHEASIMLDPAHARVMAAMLLNEADTAAPPTQSELTREEAHMFARMYGAEVTYGDEY